MRCIDACLAQLAERQTFNLVVVGSSPTAGDVGGLLFLHARRSVGDCVCRYVLFYLQYIVYLHYQVDVTVYFNSH